MHQKMTRSKCVLMRAITERAKGGTKLMGLSVLVFVEVLPSELRGLQGGSELGTQSPYTKVSLGIFFDFFFFSDCLLL